MDLEFIRQLTQPAETKIVLLIMDGLGGVPLPRDGLTALETAYTPHLDQLAAESICGLHQPVATGITPGSGPAHLGVFGYDPITYQVGRGVLSALGIGFDLQAEDVAARGNFCTLNEAGNVVDRRAGRIPSAKNRALCALLRREVELPGVEFFVETVKEYRMLLVLRGQGLDGRVDDTDPQETGVPPLDPQPLAPEAEKTANLVADFLSQARRVLADQHAANMINLRGFSKRPDWPSFEQAYGIKAAAIAGYPMYRGVAQLVGMDVLPVEDDLAQEIDLLEQRWDDYDFFFVHVKRMDSAGEDGDFDRKVALIKEVDVLLPRILDLAPDVLIVTGDHSTPAALAYHSWHPVPVLLWSQRCRPDAVDSFGERACAAGGLGSRIPAVDLMPLALAHADRLEKFGA